MMNFLMMDAGGRYRRQAAERRRRIITLVLLAVFLAGLFYWWGAENVRSSEVAYKQQAIKLQEERAAVDQTITQLRSEVQSTNMRYQQLEEKYKQEVPQGDFRKLTDLIKKQLDAGIKPDRLAFVIESARPPRNCSEAQAKKFVVKTPVYSGPHGAVSFGNGVVTVSAEGVPSVSATGAKEAWYDPGKPVKVIFTEIGGQQKIKEGLLPIQHATVVGNKEYRFTIAAGDRSFIVVTSDSCDYP